MEFSDEPVKLINIGDNEYYVHEDVADELVGETVKLAETTSVDSDPVDRDGILDLT